MNLTSLLPAKNAAPQQWYSEYIHDFISMILPGVIKFQTDHYICGNTYRSPWAIREYPTKHAFAGSRGGA